MSDGDSTLSWILVVSYLVVCMLVCGIFLRLVRSDELRDLDRQGPFRWRTLMSIVRAYQRPHHDPDRERAIKLANIYLIQALAASALAIFMFANFDSALFHIGTVLIDIIEFFADPKSSS